MGRAVVRATAERADVRAGALRSRLFMPALPVGATARLALCTCLALLGTRAGAQTAGTPRPDATPAALLSAVDTVGGTSWSPATAMPGLHTQRRAWDAMLHGSAFVQALAESGSPHYASRGVSSVNWVMATLSRPLGRGRVSARFMGSAEPWTVRNCGYPDLLATGEQCRGDSLHDRQHPHDLVMELAAVLDHPLTRSTRFQLYAGPAGEPALGPTTFLHRLSAAANPVAPVTHHWLDSSHVSFGVVTAAVYGSHWKVDASAFNGREPDERRYNVESARLDSWSGRVTVAPSSRVVLQLSGGHLREAEAGLGSLPRQDVTRVTASMSSVHAWRQTRTVATSVAYGARWGLSTVGVERLQQASHALLLESSLTARGGDTWFARAELVGKPAHDLHADEFAPAVFTVGKVQAGYVRPLVSRAGMTTALGVSLSAALLPSPLAPRYDGRVAPGAGLFLRVSPAAGHGRPAHEHASAGMHSP